MSTVKTVPMTMVEAIRDAHVVAMERDDRVVVFGEDVGFFGGVFRCTQGLQERFGDHRCFDAPISESGIVGAAVISVWAWGLLRQTSRVLLDREMDAPVVQEIREVIECDGETVIADLHVWRVGPGKYACIVGLVTAHPEPPEHYKERLHVHEELVHITVEVHHCPGEHPHPEESDRIPMRR